MHTFGRYHCKSVPCNFHVRSKIWIFQWWALGSDRFCQVGKFWSQFQGAKDHAMLVELYSSGNYLQSFNVYCEAWDGCIYRFVPESNNHRSLIFKALTQKLGIQPDQTNEFRLTGPLGESVFLDEKFRFQINRTNFRKLQRIAGCGRCSLSIFWFRNLLFLCS